jgi:hypothetical protein
MGMSLPVPPRSACRRGAATSIARTSGAASEEAGRRSDLMSATGDLRPQVVVNDVSVYRIGKESIDFHETNDMRL